MDFDNPWDPVMGEVFISEGEQGVPSHPLHAIPADGAPQATPTETIADDVDGFLDGFLHLCESVEGTGPGAVSGGLEVTDAELNWLQDPDVFMPVSSGSGQLASGHAEDVSFELHCSEEPTVDATSATPGPVGLGPPAPDDEIVSGGGGEGPSPPIEKSDAAKARDSRLRRAKVERYLEKKRRRKWSRATSYTSRQRVANTRPRHKGRFLPLESEFVPIAELQRRQRALLKQRMEHVEPQQNEAVDHEPVTVRHDVGTTGNHPTPFPGAGKGMQQSMSSTPSVCWSTGFAL